MRRFLLAAVLCSGIASAQVMPARPIALGFLATAGAAGTWFGANLPTAPTTFTTTSSPPAAAATCNGSYFTPATGAAFQTALNSAAANTCANGDVIELTAGTTYTTASGFNLPAHIGGWIYIISSHAPELGGSGLPAAGTRVCPIAGQFGVCASTNTSLANMASLRASGSGLNTIITRSSGATYYRLVGLDIEAVDANSTGINNVIEFNNSDTSLSTLAQHITIDRCYIDGAPSYGVTHAIDFDGEYMEVTESYFGTHVFTAGNGDTQDILAYNSIGPYRINDNYLQAVGESTIFGGSDTSLPSPAEPSDITETNNDFYKPIAIATGSVTSGSTTLSITAVSSGYFQITSQVSDTGGFIPTGSPTLVNAQLTGTSGDACPATDCNGTTGTYQMSAAATGTGSAEAITSLSHGKNMVEFKAGIRVLFEGNYLQNAGATGQARSAFVLTARNQSGTNPWYALTDFTVENNFFGNCQFGGTNWLLQDSATYDPGAYSTYPAKRILFRNNLFILSVNNGQSDTGTLLIQALPVSGTGNPSDLIVDHNTFIATPASGSNSYLGIITNSTPVAITLSNYVFSNNLWDKSQYAFLGASGGGSTTNWAGAFANSSITMSQLSFTNNVLTGDGSDTTIPIGNSEPANDAAVGFTSYGSNTAAAGYALTSGSTYHGVGVSGAGLPYTSAGTSDGTDIGANISALPSS